MNIFNSSDLLYETVQIRLIIIFYSVTSYMSNSVARLYFKFRNNVISNPSGLSKELNVCVFLSATLFTLHPGCLIYNV